MKILFLLLPLFSFTTFAKIPSIGDFCFRDSCSLAQQTIWQQYNEITTFKESQEASLYSGDCYHTSPIYSNEDIHHAAVFLDRYQGKYYLNGIFSFFAKKNPYKSWDIERAKQKFANSHPKEKKLKIENGLAFVDMLGDKNKAFLMYWIKKEADRLILVGLWENRHRLICELREN